MDKIHICFYCLFCNLLTDYVIAIQKENDSTAKHKENYNNNKN